MLFYLGGAKITPKCSWTVSPHVFWSRVPSPMSRKLWDMLRYPCTFLVPVPALQRHPAHLTARHSGPRACQVSALGRWWVWGALLGFLNDCSHPHLVCAVMSSTQNGQWCEEQRKVAVIQDNSRNENFAHAMCTYVSGCCQETSLGLWENNKISEWFQFYCCFSLHSAVHACFPYPSLCQLVIISKSHLFPRWKTEEKRTSFRVSPARQMHIVHCWLVNFCQIPLLYRVQFHKLAACISSAGIWCCVPCAGSVELPCRRHWAFSAALLWPQVVWTPIRWAGWKHRLTRKGWRNKVLCRASAVRRLWNSYYGIKI